MTFTDGDAFSSAMIFSFRAGASEKMHCPLVSKRNPEGQERSDNAPPLNADHVIEGLK